MHLCQRSHFSWVLSCAGSLGCSGPFLGAVHVHRALLFHPLVQNGLLKLPAVPEFEGRDFLFRHVLVKRVRTDSQVLRSLSNVHYLTRICRHKRKPFHSGLWPSTRPVEKSFCLLGGKL